MGFLTGEKIKLRAIQEADFDLLYSWRFCTKNYDFFYEVPVVNFAQYKHWLNTQLNRQDEINFLAEDLASGTAIGTISLVGIDRRNAKAEMGRVLIGNTDFRGGGRGFEMIHLLEAFAFKDLNLRKIYCEVFLDNLPAVSLYKKSGFKSEGTFVHEIFKDGAYKDVLRLAKIRGQ